MGVMAMRYKNQARLNQWTCDDLVCPKCGGRRIVNFAAPSYASAKRELSDIDGELCPSCDPMHVSGVVGESLIDERAKALKPRDHVGEAWRSINARPLFSFGVTGEFTEVSRVGTSVSRRSRAQAEVERPWGVAWAGYLECPRRWVVVNDAGAIVLLI